LRLTQVAKIPKSALIKLSSPQTREYWEIPVLYEDEHLLALDKPACLLTSPDRHDPKRPNLMRLLHDAIAQKKPWATERGLDYLMNAHRLDFETTGILLLAKSKPVLVALANLFSKPGQTNYIMRWFMEFRRKQPGKLTRRLLRIHFRPA